MRPFEGAIDDWPADRAHWLDVVISYREQAAHNAEHDTKSTAEYEAWKAKRAQEKGRPS